MPDFKDPADLAVCLRALAGFATRAVLVAFALAGMCLLAAKVLMPGGAS